MSLITANGRLVECSNPSLLPEPGQRRSIEEPVVKIEMLTPKDYIGSLMELAQDRRGEFKEMKYITENKASIIYELPLAESMFISQMVGDFFDQLKSRTIAGSMLPGKLVPGVTLQDGSRLYYRCNGLRALLLLVGLLGIGSKMNFVSPTVISDRGLELLSTTFIFSILVKTTNPKKYCVRPNAGVVLPRSTSDVIGINSSFKV
ncbi:hypothetical protein J1N35_007364 [Gossypium stocksii]|uniref:MSP domain-containing protein n=1 Tax=Gossypium stocksii TaxID=47602 RepID=A0A9D4AFI5_9ROSI|nr:hypothetical protein J1N35_007364 [Gossypium stocksii]